jgi:hypothetical protein
MDIDRVPNRGTSAATAPQRESSFSEIAAEVEAEQSSQAAAPSQASFIKPAKPFALWQDGEFGFGDFLDIINPLQHIPIVATLYRNMTGDTIGAAPRVIGGALWGRLGGFISGIVNVVVDWFTGKDIGDHIYAALFGEKNETDNQTAVAQSSNPPVISQVAPPTVQEKVSVPTVLETDHLKSPRQSTNNREVPPLSSVPPAVIPDVVSHALLSSYLRGSRHEDSDADSPRFHVKV